MTQLRACSYRWSMGLWGCRSPQRWGGAGLDQEELDGGVPGAASAWNLARRARRRLCRAGRGSAGSKGCLRGRSPRKVDLSGYLYRWALRSPLEPPWLGYRVPLAPSYRAGFRFVGVCASQRRLEGRTGAGPSRGARPGGSGGRPRRSAERQVAPGAGRGRADPALGEGGSARRVSTPQSCRARALAARPTRPSRSLRGRARREPEPPSAAARPWSPTSSCARRTRTPSSRAWIRLRPRLRPASPPC